MVILQRKNVAIPKPIKCSYTLTAAVVEMFVRVLTRVGKAEKSQQIFGWPFLRS